ncbi:MAG: diadenylate cyclase CdaA [Acidobacteriota bacterium]|nr:diadenylate cyclase CdaA [Acidobacteriota bacterium]
MDLLIDGLSQFGWNDLIEVTIITYLFYRLLLLLRRTQAMRMVWGLVVLGLFGMFANLVGFQTLDWLLSNVYAYIVIAIIVLFQNEIRRLLTQLGRTAYFRSMRRGAIDPIDEIVTAAAGMGANHHGAIIVFEREMSLSQYAEGGIALDATASYDLCVSIFNPGAPLHDGAVIMRQGRVAAAACFLPLTRNPQLSRELGSRHRAAIGISEETDCVALVVSEETGKISIVFDGQLSRGLDPVTLAERLRELLSLDDLAVEKEEIKIAEKIPQAHPAEGMGK